MNAITIYHNPRCSKSRATLALLRERGDALQVVHYLDDCPDVATIKRLAALLQLSVGDLLRRNEAEYRQLQLDARVADEDELAAIIAAHPKLLQRPIVVCGGKAAIGRPPENVLAILP